jgi:hypothetical protein
MKMKLLKTKTSASNAKRTTLIRSDLSRLLCQTTLNAAQMVLVIHKTLILNPCKLLVARAAEYFSFAHSILLRFAAQSFNKIGDLYGT